jgi:serine/threonine-protein kinase
MSVLSVSSTRGAWFGDYQVEHTLGVGGMGAVYAVRHYADSTPLAMKVLAAHFSKDTEVRGRFLREASTARALRSPHVVRVFETGVLDSGQPFMVMERLTGVDLDALLDVHGPMPLEFVLDVAIQVSEAMCEAHGLGIVHRDLKPANLFVTRRADGATRVKVFDFGISKNALWSGPSLTQTRATLGTPSYMAPEQMRSSKSVDQRADLWSLGVTMYELLTGHLPFDAPSIGQLMARIMAEEPRDVRELRPDLPENIASIIDCCLKKEPDDRYPSARALMWDLQGLDDAEDEATVQRPSLPPLYSQSRAG